ncbi:MAG: hypothetical protein ABIR52_04655, partial [Casimicrobiaceae bacterium]
MPTPPDAAASTRPATVTIAAANIYLAREIYDTYFGGAAAVALLARDGKLLVMPLVADSAGGTLLKIRNR